MKDAEEFYAPDRTVWREWLIQNHTRAQGVWLVSYKKAVGKPFVTYDEGVEEALCFGWVDSLPRKLDDERHALWYAPRKKGSRWSRPNKERVERLIANGMMMPAGLAKVEAAKGDGTWDALNDVENLIEPPDLTALLEENPLAQANWNAFPHSARRGILEWILSAKRAETRNKRIAETVVLAAQNKRAAFVRKPNSDTSRDVVKE